MPIRLTWNDENPGQNTSHRVYRSEQPMDPAALPEPVARIGSVVEYLDEAVTLGTTYYYRVEAAANGGSRVSSEVQVIAEV